MRTQVNNTSKQPITQGVVVNQNVKAGVIEVRETKRGLGYFGWNWERQKVTYIGTQRGNVYEKQAPRYRKDQTFHLSQTEYGQLRENGAGIIRIVEPGAGKYQIYVDDFEQYKQSFYDGRYGPQWSVPVSKFTDITRRKKSKVIAAPVKEQPRPLLPEYKQPGLFGYGVGERGGNGS